MHYSVCGPWRILHFTELFTNVKETRSKPFVLIIMGKHNRKKDVLIYLKNIFFVEKFVCTDIDYSENKKPITNFRLGCSKAFTSGCPGGN